MTFSRDKNKVREEVKRKYIVDREAQHKVPEMGIFVVCLRNSKEVSVIKKQRGQKRGLSWV